MKPQEKKDVAKMIALSTRELNVPNPGFLEVNDMRTHLEVLVKIRNIWLFGGFCGRDSGIGPAQRAKTTIWN